MFGESSLGANQGELFLSSVRSVHEELSSTDVLARTLAVFSVRISSVALVADLLRTRRVSEPIGWAIRHGAIELRCKVRRAHRDAMPGDAATYADMSGFAPLQSSRA